MAGRHLLQTLILSLAPTLASADGVEWLVAPYGWLPSITLDQSFDDGSGGEDGGGSAQVTDVFFGARYRRSLGEHWALALRGDYGFGDTAMRRSSSGKKSMSRRKQQTFH